MIDIKLQQPSVDANLGDAKPSDCQKSVISPRNRAQGLLSPRQSRSGDVLGIALRKAFKKKTSSADIQPTLFSSETTVLALDAGTSTTPPHCKTAQTDRRYYPRRASRCCVTICRLREHANSSAFQRSWRLHSSRLRGQLSDISRSGIAFTSRQPLHINESLLIRITNPMYDRSLLVRADVQRLGREADGNWLVVCKFQKALSFEEVHFFGSHLFRADVV